MGRDLWEKSHLGVGGSEGGRSPAVGVRSHAAPHSDLSPLPARRAPFLGAALSRGRPSLGLLTVQGRGLGPPLPLWRLQKLPGMWRQFPYYVGGVECLLSGVFWGANITEGKKDLGVSHL